MGGVATILGSSPGQPEGDELRFWVELPPGYFPLPLEDVDGALTTAEARLRELAPEQQRPLLAAVVGTLTILLEQLRERNTAFCGLGWHTAEDEAVVPSSLVVSIQPFPQKRNPRLVIKDLVEKRAQAGERGQVDVVDLTRGPAVFFESVLTLPRPQLPGAPPSEQPDAEVYQLQALVPSEDGTKVVAIDFSTPDVAHGTGFRAMMVLVADSVSFTPPPGSEEGGDRASSVTAILGGLTP